MTRDEKILKSVERMPFDIGPHVDAKPSGRDKPWAHDSHPWNKRAAAQVQKCNRKKNRRKR